MTPAVSIWGAVMSNFHENAQKTYSINLLDLKIQGVFAFFFVPVIIYQVQARKLYFPVV